MTPIEKIKQNKALRVIECFSGIGACSKALEKLNIPIEIVDAIEIDKYAVKSFNAIHNTYFMTQDITKWDKDYKDIDLICGGFPCQDISVAGKQAGIIKGKTRSGLMYELMRIIKKIKPYYVIAENVKNILSHKHKAQLEEFLCFLSDEGYKVNMDVLNACECGVPQNRERLFVVGVRNE